MARPLADLGIGTTVHYPIPIPAQPMFRGAVDVERVNAAFPESALAGAARP